MVKVNKLKWTVGNNWIIVLSVVILTELKVTNKMIHCELAI